MTAKGQDEKQAEAPPPAPQFYIAETALYVSGEYGSARAFGEGDKVPAELVEPNGWGHLVHDPDNPPDEPRRYPPVGPGPGPEAVIAVPPEDDGEPDPERTGEQPVTQKATPTPAEKDKPAEKDQKE